MKLNPDCIRAVMLEIEKSWKIQECENGELQMGSLHIDDLCSALPKYTKADIFYTIFNLEQIGYIDADIEWAHGRIPYRCCINHLSFAGHEFLNQIRDNKCWSLVKQGLSSIGNYSLNAISAVAEGFANAAISVFLKESGL